MIPINQTFTYYSDIELGKVQIKDRSKVDLWQSTAVKMGVPIYLAISNLLIDLEWPGVSYEDAPVYTPAFNYINNLIDIEYPVRLYYTKEEELKAPVLIRYEDYLTQRDCLLEKKVGILVSPNLDDRPDVLYLRHYNKKHSKKFLNLFGL